jgi:hypothetical protein
LTVTDGLHTKAIAEIGSMGIEITQSVIILLKYQQIGEGIFLIRTFEASNKILSI